jgi:aspartate/methionine/tyrosine aminotransferase
MEFLNVGGRSWEELARSRELVHMGHNCNQLELDDAIHAAMIGAIEEDEYRNYTPPYGFEELRALIRDDVGVPGLDVLVTQGATEAIFQAMSTVLQPGDQAIVSDPGWPHIGNFARQLGAEVVEVPMYPGVTAGKLTADVVRAYVTPRTKLVALVDPLNPLGTSYAEDEVKELCRLVEEIDAYLLHDATYRDFAAHGHFPAVRYSPRAFMNVSLSKICGFAGLRVGATLASPAFVRKVAERQVSRLGGNWIAQKGAIAAYRTKANWRPNVVLINRRNQQMLREALAAVPGLRPLVFPSSGNFVAVDVTGTGRTAEDVVSMALDAGFVIRSGGYTSPRFGDRFVRITTTVATADMQRFCEALPGLLPPSRRARPRAAAI